MSVVVSSSSEKRSLVKKAICTASELYTYPTASTSTIDISSGSIVFTWDTSCTNLEGNVDLTIRAPSLSMTLIKQYKLLSFSSGSKSVELNPASWGSISNISLQATLSSSDGYFGDSAPVGPLFTVTYPADLLSTAASGTATGSTVSAAHTANPDAIIVFPSAKQGLSAGIVAVAVIIPIVVILVGVFFYVKRVRAKQAKKRERWSQHVDNRMSVLSQHWQPGTSVGRPSGQLNRDTLHVRGASTSTFATGDNLAGMGTQRHAFDPSWQNQTLVGEQPDMTEYSRHSQLFSSTRPTSSATYDAPDRQTRPFSTATGAAGGPGGNGHGRAISMFDSSKSGRVSFAVEGQQRPSRLSMGDALRPAPSSLRAASNHSASNSVFSFLGNVLGAATGSGGKKRSGNASVTSLPSAVRSSMFSSKSAGAAGGLPRKSFHAGDDKAGSFYSGGEKDGQEDEDEKMEELEGGLSPKLDQEPWVLGGDEHERFDEKASYVQPAPSPPVYHSSNSYVSPFPSGAPSETVSPDDLLKAYAAGTVQRGSFASGGTPAFEVGEAQGGLSAGENVEQPTMATHLRPMSAASMGGNNPFRQSMMSDASAYSAATAGNAAAPHNPRASRRVSDDHEHRE